MGRTIFSLILTLGGVAFMAWAYSALPAGDESRRQLWGLGQSNYHEFREKLGARRLPDFTAERFLHGAETSPAPVVSGIADGRVAFPVELTLRGDGPVYYTLDGSIPTRNSPRYTRAIRIDASSVVRARVLDNKRLPGPVRSWHFIDDPGGKIPVLSVAMDPVGLWNKYSGIYANPTSRGRSWEREGQVAFVELGSAALHFDGELRVHGGYSRLVPKKSLRIRFADSAVAALPQEHPLRAGYAGTNTVVVRGDAGNPALRARDAAASALYEGLGGTVSHRAPVALYLNGDYWGVYDLRERVGDTFLAHRFGPGTYEHLTHDSERASHWLTPVLGDAEGWTDTMEELRALKLSEPEGLARAAELIDLEGTIDYWLHNIITGNVDWPYNNVHLYRRLDGADRRWKWIGWDMDPTFIHVGHNTLAWALRDRIRNDLKWNYEPGAYEDREEFMASTEPLRLLLGNPEFAERFVARAQVLMDLYYTDERVGELVDSLTSPLMAAYVRDAARWGWSDSTYHDALESIRQFPSERAAHFRRHLASQFGLGPDFEQVRLKLLPGETIHVERLPVPAEGVTLNVLRGTRLRVSRKTEGAAQPSVEEIRIGG